jgi:hypothetical protein
VSTPPDAFSDENNTQEAPQEAEQTSPDEQLVTTTTQSEEPLSPQETALPPEAQGETHGGPLGCCLGTVAGLFLMAFLTTGIPLLLSQHSLFGTMALPLSLVAAIFCGFLGWQIGKRVYREYELSPRQKRKLEAWEKRRTAQQTRKRQRLS